MSGAVTELVAQGVQDAFLTGDPQMSYFKQVYRRYTNFSQEYVRQVFKGQPAAGGMSSCTMSKCGDLLSGMYLSSELGIAGVPLANLVEKIELYIGGQKIDGYSGLSSLMFNNCGVVNKSDYITAISANTFQPLYFFNCYNYATCIPLVALQYHEVDVRIYWKTGITLPSDIALYVNNIYLDIQERQAIIKSPMNIVITQHQEVKVQGGQKIVDLPFSHPVKVILVRKADGFVIDGVRYINPILTMAGTFTLTMNGQERFEPQIQQFFKIVQPYYHGASIASKKLIDFVYSFALDYSQYNPCGTCNFSRLDNVRIQAASGTFGDASEPLMITAINYNVLKIENGMGGVMFAN